MFKWKKSVLEALILLGFAGSSMAQTAADSAKVATDTSRSIMATAPLNAKAAKRAEAKKKRMAAPVDSFKGWHVGLGGSAVLTIPKVKSFTGGELTDTQVAWGWRAGVEMLVGFNNWIGLTFGANYGEKTVVSKFNLPVLDTVFNLYDRNKFGTLSIPVGLKFHVPRLGRRCALSPILGANLEVNMNIQSSRDSVETNTFGSFLVHNRDSNLDRVKRLGFSAFGGLALDIKFGSTMLSIGSTYHAGFMDLFAEPAKCGLEGSADYLTIDFKYYL